MAKTQEAKTNKQENTQTTAMQKSENSMTNQSQNAGQTGLARRDQFTPSLFGTSPVSIMRRFRDEMDRLFESFGFGRSLMPSFGRDLFSGSFGEGVWSPQVEMFEQGGKLVVRADLPGLKKDEVNVEVTDDAITISGERRSESEEKGEGFYHSERSYGSFFRRIPLPEGVNTEEADATFNNGVLEVKLPAPEKRSTGRRLEIKESSESAK